MLFLSLITIIRSPVMHFSQIWPPSPILGAIFGFGYVLGHFGGQICRFWFWLNFSNFFPLFCNEIVKLGTFFNNLALLFECWFGYFHFKTTKKCFALPVARRSFTIMEFFVGLAQSQGYKPDGGQFCKSSSPSWSTCWSTCKGCKYAISFCGRGVFCHNRQ